MLYLTKNIKIGFNSIIYTGYLIKASFVLLCLIKFLIEEDSFKCFYLILKKSWVKNIVIKNFFQSLLLQYSIDTN